MVVHKNTKIGLLLREDIAAGKHCDVMDVLSAELETLGLEVTTDLTILNREVVLSVGGDGTFLAAAREAIKTDSAVAGINLGRRGFLPEIEIDNIPEMLRKVLQGYAYPRTTLTTLDRRKEDSPAINDVYITMPGKASGEFRIDVDDTTVMKYIGQGVVVSTPTGSTAMALSCGGTIIHPSAKVLQIVPVVAHSLVVRPITVDEHSKITVRVGRKVNNTAEVFFDGIGYQTTSDEIHLYNGKSFQMLQSREYNFYKRVAAKLYNDNIQYTI